MKHKYIANNISSFLDIIQDCLFDFEKAYPSGKAVFRGQSDSGYELLASLFRTEKESSFEYSQIHFLRASKFVEESDELEIAIRAQHYGYYTRLMDVSYNCLIALYFACAGKYDKDGAVFIMSVESYLPPTAIELSELYKRIIKDVDILKTINYIHQPPLIIETIKNNDRIIAQSGAFLLFFNDKHRLDDDKVIKVLVPKEIKSDILDQLHNLFNIYNGTVFPEIEPNAKDFNKNIGNRVYNGINCDDIFKKLLIDNLHNFVKSKSTEFKNKSIQIGFDKNLESVRYIRHFNNLTDFYFRNYSDDDKKEVKEELSDIFKELTK